MVTEGRRKTPVEQTLDASLWAGLNQANIAQRGPSWREIIGELRLLAFREVELYLLLKVG
jgi:hypothetical protein